VKSPKKILVFQTAFLGDVILTLPMIQILKKEFPLALIDVVTTPKAAELLSHHPAIHDVITYDKRQSQKGFTGILELSRQLRAAQYDVALVPHRSLRSAVVISLSAIPERIGFSTSAGKLLFNHIGQYVKEKHEIERNYALLSPFGITITERDLPSLYPSIGDVNTVNKFLFEREIIQQAKMIAVAPGSVWKTKRWLLERFTELSLLLIEDGNEVIIVGGREDKELGRAMMENVNHKKIHDATGELSLLQSAELIGRCKVLITNDSAPLHLGVAMRTPVVAIFGATVPSFGFGPYGTDDLVVETDGLLCRPCAIHGGNKCPITTFDCMKKIEATMVFEKVRSVLQ
jgi:heptosyltransferase II